LNSRHSWSLEDLAAYAIDKGGELLTSEYSGTRGSYIWKCRFGHEWHSSWGNVLKDRWCPECSNSPDQWLTRLHELATSKGGKCLAQGFTSAKTKVSWECKDGHVWEANWNNVYGGKWCPFCARKHVNDNRRRTIQDLKRYAANMGGYCHSEELPRVTSKVTWQCDKKHIWEATPQSVMGAKSWCPVCAREGNSARFDADRPVRLEGLKKLAAERGGECISTEYLRQSSPLQWRCGNGHEWLARSDQIIRGRWCPECAARLGERICREHFEQLFEEPFPKLRPDWLRSVESTRLELDGYSEKLKLAFEHHGSYHYEVVPPFTLDEKALEKRQRTDALKVQRCAERGVAVIEIPEVPTLTTLGDLKAFILTACRKAGRLPPKEAQERTIRLEDAYRPVTAFQTLQNHVKPKGGQIVSSHFVGWAEPMIWRCNKGHEWSSSPSSIFYQGTWCPECAGVKKKTIADMQALAKKRGGECLSTEYMTARIPLRWMCNMGHEWDAAPVSIASRNSWCPTCAGQRGNHLTIEFMRQVAIERGGLCLSDQYLNSKTKLLWKCSLGHVWGAIPSNVVNRGSWCPICAQLKAATKE